MTDENKLPPLPLERATLESGVKVYAEYTLRQYARDAIKADRKRRGEPSKLSNAEIMSLAYDVGAIPEQMTDGSLLRFARTLLARYGTTVSCQIYGHPLQACSECNHEKSLATTEQAEAYTDAKVREALLEAYRSMQELHMSLMNDTSHCVSPAQVASFAANRISALIKSKETK